MVKAYIAAFIASAGCGVSGDRLGSHEERLGIQRVWMSILLQLCLCSNVFLGTFSQVLPEKVKTSSANVRTKVAARWREISTWTSLSIYLRVEAHATLNILIGLASSEMSELRAGRYPLLLRSPLIHFTSQSNNRNTNMSR